jgi:type I restriction enzyme R subunit
MSSFISNFDFLKHHDELLLRLAETAEHCYASGLIIPL